jgi:hypothetical protein
MKIIKNISAILLLVTAFSCQKHVVEYDTTPIGDAAELQLHYFVPVAAVDSNNIYKIEMNGMVYENGTTSSAGVYSPAVVLSTYNAVPSGSTARVYTTTPGQNNIKLYAGKTFRPVYDQNVTLAKGKQNVFVYDFNKPPVVFDNGFPYPKNVTAHSDSTAWVKFYNFLYENGTTPTTLKLQYQYQYTKDVVAKVKSDWLNLGQPVSFGETTGWQPVPVIKEVELSSGSARIDYRIRMIGPGGEDLGSLKVINASNAFIDYADFWTASIGRAYHHVLSGIRTIAPRTAVRQFTAL